MSNRWTSSTLLAVVVGIVVAVIVFLSLLQFQHWRQDEANLHALVGLINYNVQAGRLVVPEASPATQVSPAPKPPESPPK